MKVDSAGSTQWAVQASGTSKPPDPIYDIATDTSGTSTIAGPYRGTWTVGATKLTASSNSSEAFVARLDKDGQLVWAQGTQTTPATKRAGAYGVAMDSKGNAYIAGSFVGSTTFGTHKKSAASSQLFGAKIDSKAAVQWLVSSSGTGSMHGMEMAADDKGNIYLTGIFSGTVQLAGTTLKAVKGPDAFVAKMNANDFVWVVGAQSSEEDLGLGVATDSTGNLRAVGRFGDTVNFNGISLTPSKTWEIYVWKLSGAP